MSKEVKIGGRSIGGKAFAFIGGPCVIESRDITLRIAGRLAALTSRLGIPFIFKASYDKANRTSVANFRGPGIEEGLKVLAAVREHFDVPVLTDVHSVGEAAIAAEVVDVLQVPALLSRQTDLLVACGKTGKPVNIKKGQFMAPHQMKYAIGKVESTGNTDIIVTERGTSFGYNNLVNDFRAFPIMREFGYPWSSMRPTASSCRQARARRPRESASFVYPLARAAIAIGVDAIFMEVHEDPAKALCDGPNSRALDDLPAVLDGTQKNKGGAVSRFGDVGREVLEKEARPFLRSGRGSTRRSTAQSLPSMRAGAESSSPAWARPASSRRRSPLPFRASAYRPSTSIRPNLSTGTSGIVQKDDLFFIISNSGETEEVITILPWIKRMGLLSIVVTGNTSRPSRAMANRARHQGGRGLSLSISSPHQPPPRPSRSGTRSRWSS